MLTCSGGDSALAADECERIGLPLPPLAPDTGAAAARAAAGAATVGNPLDYTALIWGEVRDPARHRRGDRRDPAIDQLLVLYDQPVGIDGAPDASWAAVREGILAGAAGSPVPVALASTLPELLDDEAAARFAAAGVPPVAGLRTGLACAAALGQRPATRPACARSARPPWRAPAASHDGWLAEHEAKHLLRAARLPVVEGRLVARRGRRRRRAGASSAGRSR